MSLDPFEHRQLGRTGVNVTQLGFGGGQIGEQYWKLAESDAQGAIEAAHDAGVDYWDTSPHYGHGLSEHRLGHFLRQQPRTAFSVSTKVGRLYSRPLTDPLAVDTSPWVGGLPFVFEFDYTRDAVMRSYEDSLVRLGLNRVDMLLIHDLDVTEYDGDVEKVEQRWRQLTEGGGWTALEELRSNG